MNPKQFRVPLVEVSCTVNEETLILINVTVEFDKDKARTELLSATYSVCAPMFTWVIVIVAADPEDSMTIEHLLPSEACQFPRTFKLVTFKLDDGLEIFRTPTKPAAVLAAVIFELMTTLKTVMISADTFYIKQTEVVEADIVTFN